MVDEKFDFDLNVPVRNEQRMAALKLIDQKSNISLQK